MAIPTLNELHKLQQTMRSLEEQAKSAREAAASLRKCGGYTSILQWHASRIGYQSRDYNGITNLLEDAMAEFGPAVLEILAARRELVAHEAMTQAVLKRAELGSFVTLESDNAN